jgi:hypothetical protein
LSEARIFVLAECKRCVLYETPIPGKRVLERSVADYSIDTRQNAKRRLHSACETHSSARRSPPLPEFRRTGIQGFSASNIWRSRDFYLTNKEKSKLTPLVAEIGWSHNLVILEQCKDDLERNIYLLMTQRLRRTHWMKRPGE